LRSLELRLSTYIQTEAPDVIVHTSLVNLEETVKVYLTIQPVGAYKLVCLSYNCTMLGDSLRYGRFP